MVPLVGIYRSTAAQVSKVGRGLGIIRTTAKLANREILRSALHSPPPWRGLSSNRRQRNGRAAEPRFLERSDQSRERLSIYPLAHISIVRICCHNYSEPRLIVTGRLRRGRFTKLGFYDSSGGWSPACDDRKEHAINRHVFGKSVAYHLCSLARNMSSKII